MKLENELKSSRPWPSVVFTCFVIALAILANCAALVEKLTHTLIIIVGYRQWKSSRLLITHWWWGSCSAFLPVKCPCSYESSCLLDIVNIYCYNRYWQEWTSCQESCCGHRHRICRSRSTVEGCSAMSLHRNGQMGRGWSAWTKSSYMPDWQSMHRAYNEGRELHGTSKGGSWICHSLRFCQVCDILALTYRSYSQLRRSSR